MRKFLKTVSILLLYVLLLSACGNMANAVGYDVANESVASSEMLTRTEAVPETAPETEAEAIVIYFLPEPFTDGDMSVEAALQARRSRRDFTTTLLTKEQLSQILWAAYGITQPRDEPRLRGGFRTTPSAGALYPLEIYAVIGNMDGLSSGVYRYISEEHKLVKILDGDVRSELMQAALGQRMVQDAPVSIFFSAVFDRMTGVYGERGILYAYIELGHSAQNVYLQVESLGLGTVAIGAFNDDRVREILSLPADETPLYLMPVGHFR